MNLKEARQFSQAYRDNNPERLFSLGSDYEISDDKLTETIKIAEIFWLSDNISERTAFEKALKYMIKQMENEDGKN